MLWLDTLHQEQQKIVSTPLNDEHAPEDTVRSATIAAGGLATTHRPINGFILRGLLAAAYSNAELGQKS